MKTNKHARTALSLAHTDRKDTFVEVSPTVGADLEPPAPSCRQSIPLTCQIPLWWTSVCQYPSEPRARHTPSTLVDLRVSVPIRTQGPMSLALQPPPPRVSLMDFAVCQHNPPPQCSCLFPKSMTVESQSAWRHVITQSVGKCVSLLYQLRLLAVFFRCDIHVFWMSEFKQQPSAGVKWHSHGISTLLKRLLAASVATRLRCGWLGQSGQ